MQKKQLAVILLTFCVLFSIFKLYTLMHDHPQELDAASLLRFKFLMAAHGLLLLALVGIFLLDEFHHSAMVVFIFFSLVTLALFLCEAKVKGFADHKEDDDYLVFRDKRLKLNDQKTFLSMYYLTYMYSIIGSVMVGLFILIRFLVVCYYQRKLLQQLELATTQVEYSEDLKGKECTICIADFIENSDDHYYQLNNCHHTFHSNCIKQWVHYSKTCPLCRASIFPERRSAHSIN